MIVIRHIIRLIIAWVGAAAAASVVYTLLGVVVAVYDDAVCDAACRAVRALAGTGTETWGQQILHLGAALFVMPFAMIVMLPIMVVAYPLAASVAGRVRSPGRTAAAGALAALLLVPPLGAAYLAFGASPADPWSARRIVEAIIIWAPVTAAAGATVGWIVARLNLPRASRRGGGPAGG